MNAYQAGLIKQSLLMSKKRKVLKTDMQHLVEVKNLAFLTIATGFSRSSFYRVIWLAHFRHRLFIKTFVQHLPIYTHTLRVSPPPLSIRGFVDCCNLHRMLKMGNHINIHSTLMHTKRSMDPMHRQHFDNHKNGHL